MKTFYHYDNSRKRYSATYSSGDHTILYSVEYRIKQVNIFGIRFFSWVPVASVRSTKKFQEIRYMLESKLYDDNKIRSESRRVYTNPFLHYQSYLNNK